MNEADKTLLRAADVMFDALSDRYDVVEVLGVGGMGFVVKMRHRSLGVHHALKSLNLALHRSQIIRKRFLAEARTMARLKSPHIVDVLDVHEAGVWPYMIMEYLEGGDIIQHLKTFGGMPPRQAVEVIIKVLKGLSVAHSKGVVHRDIKPDNVIFSADGEVKVADFGIAKVQEGTQMTRVESTMGSYLYMAPEQSDAASAGPRADLCAAGVTLFAMLVWSKVEVMGLQKTRLSLCELFNERPELIDLIPEDLQGVILKVTAEDCESRHEDAQALISELEGILLGLDEDPEDTPALGSAPRVARERKVVEDAAAGIDPLPSQAVGSEIGSQIAAAASGRPGTLVPHTRAMKGAMAESVGAGLASHVSHVPELRESRRPPPSRQTFSSEDFEPPGSDPGALPIGTLHEASRPMSETKLGRLEDELSSNAIRKFAWLMGTMMLIGAVIVGAVISFPDSAPEVAVVEQEPVPAEVELPPESPVEDDALASLSIDPVEVATQAPTPEPVVMVTPTPIPVRRKAKQQVTAVIAEPEETSAAPAVGTVRILISDAPNIASDDGESRTAGFTYTLSGEGETFTFTSGNRTQKLPLGTYQAKVTFEGGRVANQKMPKVTVTPGLVTVKCSFSFEGCR